MLSPGGYRAKQDHSLDIVLDIAVPKHWLLGTDGDQLRVAIVGDHRRHGMQCP